MHHNYNDSLYVICIYISIFQELDRLIKFIILSYNLFHHNSRTLLK